jgi:hypothetical protein
VACGAWWLLRARRHDVQHARRAHVGCRLDFYYEPTVVSGLEQDDEMIQQEIFGPVVTVQRIDSEEKALAWHLKLLMIASGVGSSPTQRNYPALIAVRRTSLTPHADPLGQRDVASVDALQSNQERMKAALPSVGHNQSSARTRKQTPRIRKAGGSMSQPPSTPRLCPPLPETSTRSESLIPAHLHQARRRGRTDYQLRRRTMPRITDPVATAELS